MCVQNVEFFHILGIWVLGNLYMMMALFDRYYGDGVKDQREKEELENLITATVAWFSKVIISDFVPSLGFITKLQGIYSQLEEFHKFDKEVVDRIFEPQKHRERAQERLQHPEEDDKYEADFVDVLQAAPLEDGKYLPDTDISTILSVRMTCHNSSKCMPYLWGLPSHNLSSSSALLLPLHVRKTVALCLKVVPPLFGIDFQVQIEA